MATAFDTDWLEADSRVVDRVLISATRVSTYSATKKGYECLDFVPNCHERVRRAQAVFGVSGQCEMVQVSV